MTGQVPDTEETVRNWLASSAPDRAPASVREALEDVTSGPPGHARPWPRDGRHSLILAGRIAAVVAILAVAASGAYLYGNGRVMTAASSSFSQGTDVRTTSSAGSSWRLSGAVFPQLIQSAYGWGPEPVFALPSAGFLAFVPTGTGDTTRVFRSDDGLDWRELPAFPTRGAQVYSVAASGGTVVVVGAAPSGPMAWTTSDLETWRATELPTLEAAGPFDVTVGPAGFLALGAGSTGVEDWISTNGTDWRALTVSGLPAFINNEVLFSVSGGYAIEGDSEGQFGRATVWQSTDGARWTETWQGPAPSSTAPSSTESYFMGSILQAPDGSYISFGATLVSPRVARATPRHQPVWTSVLPATPPDLLLWTSLDRIHWTLVGPIKSPGWMPDFAAIRGGFVAAGQPVSGNAGMADYGALGIWTSPDGTSWQPVVGLPSVGSVQVMSVVSDGAHAVVVCVDQQGNLQLLVGNGPT